MDIIISPQQYIESTLELGTVFHIEKPTNIDGRHYFVVVGIDEDENYMLCCTTQYEKRLQNIRHRKLPEESLVTIEPTESNGLTQMTYLDCNGGDPYTKEKLVDWKTKDELVYSGRLSEEDYSNVIDKIYRSDASDIPKHLLQYNYSH